VRSRRRLQTRIARYIAFTVVVSLVVTAVGLLIARYISLRHAMEENARTYAALTSLPLVRAADVFRSTGRHMLQQRVTQWRDLSRDVVSFEVVDVNGVVVMRADPEDVVTYASADVAPRVEDPELLEAIRRLDPTAGRLTVPGEPRQYRVVAPAVEEWGRHTYSLVATFSYNSVNRQLLQATWLVLLHLVVGLVFADRVSVVLAGTITRSLERLHAGVRRIQEGHLDERVEVDSDDEIEDLADAFNAMAEKLLRTVDELQGANRELESLDQAKADLLANVSHELKTPLTALRGYQELLLQGDLGELPPEASRAIEVCQKNVRRLTLRIEELVQLSQLERTVVPDLELHTVHLGQLLHGVMETLLPRLEDKGILCSLNLATDLPSALGNPEDLERVFLNLLDNASKFTSEGGFIRVSAEPYTHDGRSGVLTRVADTGVGIPRSEQLRIFDRFYQVDPSARRRHGGMGLGLSLVRSIVEAHRGAVWVESEESRGSTFFVWIHCHSSDSSSSRHAAVRWSGSGRLEPVGKASKSDTGRRP